MPDNLAGLIEVEARVRAAVQRLGDFKVLWTEWYEGREVADRVLLMQMEAIVNSAGLYLKGAAGPLWVTK